MLTKEIYIEHLEGFEEKGKGYFIFKLQESLLLESPRQLSKMFYSFIMSQNYNRIIAYHCMYVIHFPRCKFNIL